MDIIPCLAYTMYADMEVEGRRKGLEKIIIKTARGTDPVLLDIIRILFPECEVCILMDPDEGRIAEGIPNEAT